MFKTRKREVKEIREQFDRCCKENLQFVMALWQQHAEGQWGGKMRYFLAFQEYYECLKCNKRYIHTVEEIDISGTIKKNESGWYRP
jgi:hypothetical protein